MRCLRKSLFVLLMLTAMSAWSFDPEGAPVFDAHIHYSHDVWDSVSPQEAVRRLREVGIERAMVSSSSDEGTQRLYDAAPELVIPVLRPYRQRGTLDSWFHDKTVVPYLKERLAKYRYVAIGEFHVDGEEADLPVVREIVQLAKQHQLVLHVHGDRHAIERIYKQDPQAQILWAHAGFEYAKDVRALMRKHEKLWADLSFRREIYTNKRFLYGWRELLTAYPDRFLLGIDTYIPSRWVLDKMQLEMNWQRDLLQALPAEVAANIAFENGERIFTSRFRKTSRQ